MTDMDLQHKLALHYAWLNSLQPQERASLRGVDLSGASLRGVDLSGADLRETDLRETGLRGADLSGADLRETDLRGANLRETDLNWANLRGANLRGADLRETGLRGVDLSGVDLRGADLDFSSWPLQCGSLKAIVDDKLKAQLLYHVISVSSASFFTLEQLKFANTFHQVSNGNCEELTHEDNN